MESKVEAMERIERPERTELFPGGIIVQSPSLPLCPTSEKEARQVQSFNVLRELKTEGLMGTLVYASRLFPNEKEVVRQLIEEYIIEKGTWLLKKADGEFTMRQLTPEEKNLARAYTEHQIFVTSHRLVGSKARLPEFREKYEYLENKLEETKENLNNDPANRNIIMTALGKIFRKSERETSIPF